MKKLITVVMTALCAVAQAGTYYVDANAAEGGTGTSWGDAFNSLGAALEVATAEGDEILLAGNDLSPAATFAITNHPGLVIRGGYTGADDVTRTGRTRIVGKSSGTRFRIFDLSASTVTFDGVSVEKGYAPVNGSAGQGVQVTGESSVIFTNCAFVGNGGYAGADKWTQYGGAISAQDGTLRITDCDFSGNSLRYGNHYYPHGGAIYAKNESVQIVNTRFDKNYCDPGWDTVPKGGAIMLESCSRPFIDNCTFTTNWLEKDAGANTSIGGTLHLASCTDATIRDCRVLGGYIKDGGSSPYLTTGQAF